MCLVFLTAFRFVDYDDAVVITAEQKTNPETVFRHQTYKKLWNKFLGKRSVNSVSMEQKIPKILHFVWLGSQVPGRLKKFIASWIDKHPDWTYKIWKDDDAQEFGLENIKAFNANKNFGFKSDLFRYEILYRHGGIYLDCDFLCLDSLDFIHDNISFYACFFQNSIVANGLIGSVANHPILHKCIYEFNKNLVITQPNEDIKIQIESGPAYFTRKIFDYLKTDGDDQDIVIFPTNYFFSFDPTKKNQFWKGNITLANSLASLPEEAIGVHYWATSWVKND